MQDDPDLQVASGKQADPDTSLAAPPTLCHLENRVKRKALVKMSEVLVDRFNSVLSTPPTEIVLDFDTIDDPVHGQQDQRFFCGC